MKVCFFFCLLLFSCVGTRFAMDLSQIQGLLPAVYKPDSKSENVDALDALTCMTTQRDRVNINPNLYLEHVEGFIQHNRSGSFYSTLTFRTN